METLGRDELLKLHLEALRLYDANNTCLTIEECAEWFKIHRDTVVRRLHSGEWKGHLIGRVWRIPKMQFLEQIVNDSPIREEKIIKPREMTKSEIQQAQFRESFLSRKNKKKS